MGTSKSVEQIVDDFHYVDTNLNITPEKIMEVLHLAYQYDMMLEENKEFLDDKTNGE